MVEVKTRVDLSDVKAVVSRKMKEIRNALGRFVKRSWSSSPATPTSPAGPAPWEIAAGTLASEACPLPRVYPSPGGVLDLNTLQVPDVNPRTPAAATSTHIASPAQLEVPPIHQHRPVVPDNPVPTDEIATLVDVLLSYADSQSVRDARYWSSLYERHIGFCIFSSTAPRRDDLSSPISSPGASTSTALHMGIVCTNQTHRDLGLRCSIPIRVGIHVILSELLRQLQASQTAQMTQVLGVVDRLLTQGQGSAAHSPRAGPSTTGGATSGSNRHGKNRDETQ